MRVTERGGTLELLHRGPPVVLQAAAVLFGAVMTMAFVHDFIEDHTPPPWGTVGTLMVGVLVAAMLTGAGNGLYPTIHTLLTGGPDPSIRIRWRRPFSWRTEERMLPIRDVVEAFIEHAKDSEGEPVRFVSLRIQDGSIVRLNGLNSQDEAVNRAIARRINDFLERQSR